MICTCSLEWSYRCLVMHVPTPKILENIFERFHITFHNVVAAKALVVAKGFSGIQNGLWDIISILRNSQSLGFFPEGSKNSKALALLALSFHFSLFLSISLCLVLISQNAYAFTTQPAHDLRACSFEFIWHNRTQKWENTSAPYMSKLVLKRKYWFLCMILKNVSDFQNHTQKLKFSI